MHTGKCTKCRTFSLINFPYFTPSQIPICIVSKGAVPCTRKEKLTMVQSCNFTLIDPSDYSRRMQKNAYPLVVCYNGRDHYVPTKPTTYHAYYKWKTEKELAPILSAGLIVIEEMDLQFLSDEQKQACNEIEACIVKHLLTLSQQVNAAHHAMVARAPGHGAHGGLCFIYPPALSLLLLESMTCLLPSPLFFHSAHTSARCWRRCSSFCHKKERLYICLPFVWQGDSQGKPSPHRAFVDQSSSR